ncbi:MAG: hypothetical protein BRC32_00235 [Actinobacteria bacterium QS_8_72_14]|nr:MAG: hypothetical protein BRC32_00235 [Actinobacteria bacterium QS_8_72_14]
MPGPHDEQHFESAVVHELTTWSGWQERPAGDYDRHLRLVPADLETFLRATQPDAVDQLIERLGDGWLRKTCEVLTRSLKRPGDALKLLRRGKNVHGVQLSLAYFKPTHGLNPDVVARYDANVLTVIRQVPYSPEHGNTVDVGLFVNGLPVADAELKNGTSQRVGDAVEHRAVGQHDHLVEHLAVVGVEQVRQPVREPQLSARRRITPHVVSVAPSVPAGRVDGPAGVVHPRRASRPRRPAGRSDDDLPAVPPVGLRAPVRRRRPPARGGA